MKFLTFGLAQFEKKIGLLNVFHKGRKLYYRPVSESNYDLPETQLNKSVGVGGENFATNTVGKISP